MGDSKQGRSLLGLGLGRQRGSNKSVDPSLQFNSLSENNITTSSITKSTSTLQSTSSSPQSSSKSSVSASTSFSSATESSAFLSPPAHHHLLPLKLPPLPPPPPEDFNTDYSQRPSTAPDSLAHKNSSSLSGSSKGSRRGVRKAPTVANLSDLNNRSSRKPSLSSSSRTILGNSLSSTTLTPGPRPVSRERRSSSSKRPPASFSANGIETSYGPPPALITRSSSYNSELARLVQSPAASVFAAATSQKTPSQSPSSVLSPDQSTAPQATQFLLSPAPASKKKREMNSLDAVVRDGTMNSWEQQHNMTPGSGTAYRDRYHEDEGLESSQSSEDLFLKLAENTTDGDDTLKLNSVSLSYQS